jgi:hypothetical protein
MCITAQTRAGKSGRIVQRPDVWTTDCMLLIIGILITMTLAAIILRLRVPGGVNATNLGWMSAQWLAEHRSSRRS